MSNALSRSDNDPPAGDMLHTFIREGRSFSGRERNCCFLNLGASSRQFVDVSSISGFDFPDDGRAVGRVDWDHDGDVDLWVANRSGPQVRFLRNDSSGGGFLALQLVGTTSNRDGIGARVELELGAEGGAGGREASRTLTKTVRAGDGFLTQSSKWLHFGLGTAREIRRLTVRWPGGAAEEIEGTRAGGRYRVVQGSGRSERLMAQPRALALRRSEVPPSSAGEAVRLVSRARLPVPRLSYRGFDGRESPVFEPAKPHERGAPTLLTLWASWCAPCLVELREIADRAEELRSVGLTVVALSVDGLQEDPPKEPTELREILRRLEFPFVAGMATEQTVRKLDMVRERLFDLHRPLPVPVSFLIDQDGALAVLYRGRLEVGRLARDVRAIASSDSSDRPHSLPFAGRWLREPGRMSPFSLAWELCERGYAEDGIEYVERHRALLESHIRFPRLLVLIGNAHLARGEPRLSMSRYREALSLDSDYLDAQNNLAWLLSTQPDAQLRNGPEAVRLAEAAMRASKGSSASVWNTLSAAYAEAGQFEKAVAAAERALDLAERSGQTKLRESSVRLLELFRARQPYRTR